jgi:hypothetical protein
MMTFCFGDFADVVHKGESLLEIRKAEFANEMMLVHHIPERQLLMQLLERFAFQGRDCSGAGDAFPIS